MKLSTLFYPYIKESKLDEFSMDLFHDFHVSINFLEAV